MRDPIYLDHNATTPLLPEALDAMLPYLRGKFGNPSSQHAHGQIARHIAGHVGAQLGSRSFVAHAVKSIRSWRVRS